MDQFSHRCAIQRDLAAAFDEWGESLREALPARILQAIALTVATHTGSDYERLRHERVALDMGMTQDEIEALERMRGGTCATLAEEEVAAATLARVMLEDFGRGSGPALLRVSRLLGEPVAVACLMATMYYGAIGAMANVWGLDPAFASPDGHHR